MKIIFSFLFFSLLLIAPIRAQFWVDVESGLVLGTPYNKISIPNSAGSRFDLGKDFKIQPIAFLRARIGYTFNDRHTITALYAPLTATYDGQFDQVVNFNSIAFAPNQPITATYRFNSYRLTYRYGLIRNERFRLGVGFTAKIRDARIRLISPTQNNYFDNVGFVPLLNVLAEYRPTDHWRILLEVDALGGGPGRAEDVFLGIGYQLTPSFGLRTGYRVVEGGADVKSIYNFTWISYASVGVHINF
jgi:hypothetical protein